MAREESDREDLLREATALVERVELAPAGTAKGEHVVAGFRADGALSVYFGGDTAYHFNSAGELRRAHSDGLLYKAERGVLVSLERVRTPNVVQLVRRPLSDAERAEFLATMLDRLSDFKSKCQEHALVTVGQVPAETNVIGRVLDWLAMRRKITIAPSPHAR